MTSRDFHLHNGQKGAALAIRVITRARRNEIVEVLNDGTVKVRLKAPSKDDETNRVLIEFLAQLLDVPKTRIEIVAGEIGRDKLVSVLDLDADAVHDRILNNLS